MRVACISFPNDVILKRTSEPNSGIRLQHEPLHCRRSAYCVGRNIMIYYNGMVLYYYLFCYFRYCHKRIKFMRGMRLPQYLLLRYDKNERFYNVYHAVPLYPSTDHKLSKSKQTKMLCAFRISVLYYTSALCSMSLT